MATTNLPISAFKLAVVRAPRKPVVTEAGARRITYSLNSAFYTTLKTNRAGANPRPTMITSATTFKTSNALYIASLSVLKSLFPNFDRIDDYLRIQQKKAVKADLKPLVEGPLVLNQTATAYVGAGGYAALKSRVWDNVFALSVLGESAVLRTEEIRILRLLNVIEKIAANDTLLDTGAGIFSAYLSIVLLPGDVFPLPDVVLPTEPTTQPEPADPTAALKTQLEQLRAAYTEIKGVYDRQNYEYRELKYPKRDELDPDDDLQKNLLNHDPLALNPAKSSGLSVPTLAQLTRFNIKDTFVYMPYVHDKFGSEIRRLGRLVNATKERQTVARIGGALIMMGNECVKPTLESPCKPFVFAQWPGGAGHVRPIGVADLKVVQTQLYKYELGEVAHIENILQGETRKRTFRDLERQEVIIEQIQETTKESEKETQTTERFELHQESSNVVQQDQANQIGVTASISYGPMGSGTLNASTSSSMSQAEANSQATTYAKDVMERALQRVIEKTRTRKQVTTIVEHEDTTEHGFDNTTLGGGGTNNITGVYRWLDKLYYNQVVNYGRRMMFEFIVPEPAAFYLFSKLAKPMSNEVIEAPPAFDITSFESITSENYDEYAVRFGATSVKPPPSSITTVSATKSVDPVGPEWTSWVEKLTVPAGYVANSARISILLSPGSGNYISIAVGTASPVTRYNYDTIDMPIPQTTGDIPINMRTFSNHYAVAVEIFCAPTAETFQQWQIDTYAALKTAYDQKVSEYNRWLREQQDAAFISGNNPLLNRQVERKELKKHCIEFISGQRFESFDALRNNAAPYGYPEFSFADAATEGKYIQFFEQAFEWDQMTYLFYPYFWARKKEWVNILHRDENDPLFMNFLQAGAARVLIPVRNSYVKAVLHYLNTGGEIWNGEDVPAPDDPLYVSIIDEIMEADGYFEGGEVVGEPWLSKVPTSLVYLQDGATLPDNSADLPL